MIGAGFMAQGLTNQIVNSVPGMRMVAVYNRQARARGRRLSSTRALRVRGASIAAGERSSDRSARGQPVVTEDAIAALPVASRSTCSSTSPARSSSARTWSLEAFEHGKDVVLMNAEIDATIGPILQVYAAKHGVDPVGLRRRRAGRPDEPVPLGQGPRATPRVIGNIKGLQDPVSQPDDAEGLRRAVGPEPGDGHVLRRRLEDQLRAGDRRQRDRLPVSSRAACRAARVSTATS